MNCQWASHCIQLCPGASEGAAGAAKAAPIILDFFFFFFFFFFFYIFNLVDGLSTLVQVPYFTSTMRCVMSMHILISHIIR